MAVDDRDTATCDDRTPEKGVFIEGMARSQKLGVSLLFYRGLQALSVGIGRRSEFFFSRTFDMGDLLNLHRCSHNFWKDLQIHRCPRKLRWLKKRLDCRSADTAIQFSSVFLILAIRERMSKSQQRHLARPGSECIGWIWAKYVIWNQTKLHLSAVNLHLTDYSITYSPIETGEMAYKLVK